MQQQIKILATSIVTLFGGQAFGEAPPPGDVIIQSISNSGPGCYPGSVAKNLSDDGKPIDLPGAA